MHQLPIFLAAVAIDLDPTAILMGAMFILLYFVLQPLIVNDYMRARELRRDAITGAREDAAESQALAEARMMEFEDEMKVARRDAADVRESLKGQGTAEQRDIIEEARAEVQEQLAAERATVAEQVAAAQKELETRAATLSKAMVDKILPSVS